MGGFLRWRGKVGEKMIQATIKSYDPTKGWGYITTPQDGDVYFHRRAIEGRSRVPIQKGPAVEMVIVQGQRGPQAAHVTIMQRED